MNEITQLLHIDPLLLQALREDIPEEDVSTNAVMPHACPGTVDLIAKEDGIVAGLAVYARVFTLLDPGAKMEFFCRDGDTVQPGQFSFLFWSEVFSVYTVSRDTYDNIFTAHDLFVNS